MSLEPAGEAAGLLDPAVQEQNEEGPAGWEVLPSGDENPASSGSGTAIGHTLKNYAYNTLCQLLMLIVPLITTPYVCRVLGASGVGVYSYHYAVAGYFVLFVLLGLNNYGSREIALNRSRPEQLSQTFWEIYWFQLLHGLAIWALYLIWCVCGCRNPIMGLILSAYVLSGILDISWFFAGMEQFRLMTLRSAGIKLVTTAAIFLLVKQPADVFLYAAILSGGFLVSSLLLWPRLLETVGFCRVSRSGVVRHIRPNLWLFLAVLAVSIYKYMDKIMLGMMAGEQPVGLYESAEKIIQIPTLLVTSLGTVMLPRMSLLAAQGQESPREASCRESRVIGGSLQLIEWVTAGLSFGIMAVAPVFVPWFYGPGFEGCIPLYLILLPSCLFLAFSNVLRTQYVLPHQMDTLQLQSVGCGAVINLLVNLACIPVWQASGAAAGTWMAEMSVCACMAWRLRRLLPVGRWIRQVPPFVLAGLLSFMVTAAIGPISAVPLVSMGLGLLMFAGIYLAMLGMLSCWIKDLRTAMEQAAAYAGQQWGSWKRARQGLNTPERSL